MLSEAELVAKRAALRWLAQQHPEWTSQDLADALDLSRSWIHKWLQRLRQGDPADLLALHSRSRARHSPPFSIASQRVSPFPRRISSTTTTSGPIRHAPVATSPRVWPIQPFQRSRVFQKWLIRTAGSYRLRDRLLLGRSGPMER
jgi:hypothetical protein